MVHWDGADLNKLPPGRATPSLSTPLALLQAPLGVASSSASCPAPTASAPAATPPLPLEVEETEARHVAPLAVTVPIGPEDARIDLPRSAPAHEQAYEAPPTAGTASAARGSESPRRGPGDAVGSGSPLQRSLAAPVAAPADHSVLVLVAPARAPVGRAASGQCGSKGRTSLSPTASDPRMLA